MKSKGIDKIFLFITAILVAGGLFIFSSASMGLLAREGADFSTVLIKQILAGFVLGGILLIVAAKIPYKNWRKFALPFLIISIIACALVFTKYGIAHGGARRWLDVFGFSFQPAELLKIGIVIYFAAWIASVKDKIATFKYGALPLFVLLTISGALIIKQPDTGTFLVVFAALIVMFITAGGKWKYLFITIAICAVGIFALAEMRPYLKSRINTFIDPSSDALGSGYQIQQSMIAIGSGGFMGRGFGQSVQKFNFLPEPIGDSIFAVASEEFGFIGASLIIAMFVLFLLRGYSIAVKSSDTFGSMLAIGLVTLITTQALINIGSMLGIIPLTGIPLTFISHGGTAMLFALFEVGIILNISKKNRV